MYAVIDNKGKQYKVAMGEEFLVDLMKADIGDTVEFDKVLMLGGAEGQTPSIGQPNVDGASVTAEVVRHEKGPKVTIVRFKGPNQTKKGHRQKYTLMRVKDITPKLGV